MLEGSKHFELLLKNHVFLVKVIISESITLLFTSSRVCVLICLLVLVVIQCCLDAGFEFSLSLLLPFRLSNKSEVARKECKEVLCFLA